MPNQIGYTDIVCKGCGLLARVRAYDTRTNSFCTNRCANKFHNPKRLGVCSIAGCEKAESTGGYCQMHGWRLKYHGDPLYQRSPRARCSISDCDRVTKSYGLCQLHLRRKRRGLPSNYSRPISAAKRYLLKSLPGHPLADRLGRVYVHRLVLFQSIGWMSVPCFWCARAVSFGDRTLIPDHLDHNRQRNALSNLVPSCNSCNAGRTRSNPRVRHSVYACFPVAEFVWEGTDERVGS
jgi:hypothetical protein